MGKKYRDLVAQYSEQRRGKRSVLNTLANFANDNGEVWISNDTIATHAGLSIRAVQYNIDALLETDELEIIKIGNGRGNTTVYRLNHAELAPFTGQERVQDTTIKGASFTQKGASSAIKGAKNDNAYIGIDLLDQNNIDDDAHASDASAHLEPEQPAAPTAPLSQKRLVNAFGRPIDGPEIVLDDLPSGPKSATPAKNVKVYHRAAVARFDPRKIRADGLIDKGQGANELEIWLEGFPQKPTEAQMRDMREKVPPEKYDRWREVIQETSIRGFKSYQNVMDVFLNGWRNGSKPPSHPTVSAKKVEFAIAGLL